MSELNTRVRFRVRSSQLQSVPVDDTLSIQGQAADAAAVGAALAQKADLSQVTGIKVNGQAADQQGLIYVDGSDIPVSGEDSTLISAKIAALDAKTAANIPMSAESGAQSIADAINGSVNRAADAIPLEAGSETMVKDAIEGLQGDTEDLQEDVGGLETAALGSDYDGIDCSLSWGAARDSGALLRAMEAAGLTEEEIEAVTWKNVWRFFRETL